MKNVRFGFLATAIFAIGIAFTSPSHAAAPPPDNGGQIPDALKPWEDWALWDVATRACPTPFSDAHKHLCFWPSRIGLQATQTGAQFDMVVTVYSETWVPLPGGTGTWPVGVKVNDAPVVVIEHNSNPAVHLNAGTFHLVGEYHWKSMPQRICIPREIGILALIIDGQPVESPSWDENGYLRLQAKVVTEEPEKSFLSMKLYSMVEDGIPLWLHTEVELLVSGKSREEDLGIVLPEGWRLGSVEGQVPVMVDEKGRMKAQVRTGKWLIHVDAFRFDNPQEFHFAAGAKPAVADELVGFQAKRDFRTVEITGLALVDVSQTTFPEAWRSLPVYRWNTSTPFRIEERMRGMGQQKPEPLHISREWWLDDSGRELTFRDVIDGRRQQIWRLDAAQEAELGSVRNSGQGQLITRNPDNGATGVEIRTRDVSLEATGRMARTSLIPASGWRADADGLRVTLHLPPGWRLFALFGADWVRGDWLTAWSLLDLFLLLVFTLAVFRLWGLGAAVLAFVALGLSYHEAGAPRYLWLILLVPLALQRVVPEGWGRRIVGCGKWIIIVTFLLVFVPFLARQVEQALYPQLEAVAEFRGTSWGHFGTSHDYEQPVPAAAPEAAPSPQGSTEAIRHKLEQIVIPKLEFREASIREAVDFLKQKSVELDQSSSGERGVNIVLKLEPPYDNMPNAPAIPGVPGLDVPGLPPSQMGNPADARITVSLSNIPFIEALKYVTGLANLKYKIEPNGISITPMTENTDVLITKEWIVPPDLIPVTSSIVSKGAYSQDATRGGKGVADRESSKNWLISNGVTFNGNASAIYIVRSNRLIVRNTQDQLDLIDNILGSSNAAAGSAQGANNLSYDAKARIQTGPGVPEWKWRAVSFGWNGPVSSSQQVRPVLISLAMERVLTVLRIGLLLLLAAVLFDVRKLRAPSVPAGAKTAAAVLLFAFTIAHGSAQTSIPDSTTLEKLRERLLKPSDAYPHAADIPSVTLTLQQNKVTMDAEIHAAIRTAVPIPGRLPAWSPINVLVDDKPEVSLRRDDGFLWVVLEAGIHHVHVEGSLGNITEWEWNYVLLPRQLKVDAPDWNVSGIKADGVPEAQVFLSRKQKVVAAQSSYDQPALQTVVSVERELELGLVWEVHTVVKRLTPTGRATELRVPLLPGENVLTPEAVVKEGFIEIRLGARDQSFAWESELSVTKQLSLATRPDDTWVEHWRLVASPVWNVTLAGLTPTFEQPDSRLVPVWHPWPGEKVDLSVSRPEAIAGATMTVNHATHELTLGRRQRTAKLNLSLRSSLGENFLVELPADAEVTSLVHDGNAVPVHKEAGKLVIPLHPGEQNVAIDWKRDVSLGASTAIDDVRLPVESANVSSTISVPEDRWVLWAGGPQRGPAVRFWGILICALLAALALGRMARSPLKTAEWMLLVIGLTQVPLAAGLAVVGWLFFVTWRGGEGFQRLSRYSYNVLQIFLILLTIAALVILIAAVGEGLLGRPEMFIAGNDSTATELHWFKARSEDSLPHCRCLSVSIWWYRLFMLIWALWLAMALIRWLQRGWKNFGTGGYFHHKPKKAPAPSTTPTTPTTPNPPPLPAQS
ncbi:hypothetical protein CfE428DRAFT_3821 [Chthoniobacter flavus Ellin428]|uniref:FHA domain containing protein n=1 Tax=Chthoniobacter flavus Ellin428 TaxID=497964 RepID=B4D4I3_9BACT|nr:hypothetical protein [Chthoniobacter flavus]EDY18784.1 hypothetical protein CfE428DRAFT_3821 [Chthoniobacter flavus Ellin428]TCO88981.1 hypothetical protein EV701_1152 [Chthoniobacter flavus]